MRNIIVAITATVIASSSFIALASADYVDDQLANSIKRLESAERSVAKWEACVADRDTCATELEEKAIASVERARARLEVITATGPVAETE